MLKIYTKKQCPNCDKAKALLASKGVLYTTIDVEKTDGARDFLVSQGLRSVPQIYNNDDLVPGGYEGLSKQPIEFFNQFMGDLC